MPFFKFYLFNLTNFLFFIFNMIFILKSEIVKNDFLIIIFLRIIFKKFDNQIIFLSKFSRLSDYGSDLSGQIIMQYISFTYLNCYLTKD